MNLSRLGHRNRFYNLRTLGCTLALAGTLAGFAPLLTPARAGSTPKLEIWPGKRVLLLLPLTTGPNWNVDPQLGKAVIPIVAPTLQSALTATGKFSLTLPYRFDPIMRRAVLEKRVTDADVTALLGNPSLETATPVLSNLVFDQAAMVADVKLEELRVGGTPNSPTLQVQVSGRLYEQGGASPVKSIVTTSKPASGGSPADRISRACAQAFAEIAAQFVMPPPDFALPIPLPVATVAATPAPVTATPAPPTPEVAPPVAIPREDVQVTRPNSLTPDPGTPFLPQLPPAQAPLGIAVPNEPAGTR